MESPDNKKTSAVSYLEFEEKLVLAVSQFECIFNKTDSRYQCKLSNDSSWIKVARAVQRPIAECVDKWHFLFQIFLHFSRLENKYGYDWCCLQWRPYESFKKMQKKLAQSYTELLTMKVVSKKSTPRESAERWLLIQQIETIKYELMERTTSCMRRQELWTDIATCLNEKFPIPQRCVIGWQMVWWELKQQLLSLLDTKDYKFSKEQLRIFSIYGIKSATDADAKEKFLLAYEFGENVSDSICINCPSSSGFDLIEGICTGCMKKQSTVKCQICLKNKGSCSLTITAWRDIARKLIPKSLRCKEAITICSHCQLSLKLRGARQWRACRICGESKQTLENLMNPSYTRLKRIFHSAVGCTFSLADGLPCFICNKCHGEFVEFIRFYVIFSNTQTKLQKIHEKSLIGDELPDRGKVYETEEKPQRHSKRHQSQMEIDYYLAKNGKSLETGESKYETLLNIRNHGFDKAHTVKNANPVDAPNSVYPVTLIKKTCNKRSRSQSPVVLKPVKTYKNLRKEAKRIDKVTNCDLAEESNAKQTRDIGRTSTISLRRKTLNGSDLCFEESEDLANSNRNDSLSKLEATTSMDCDPNEAVLKIEFPTSGRASIFSSSSTEAETESASFTNSDTNYESEASKSSRDFHDSLTTIKTEADVEIVKTSTKQNQSQDNSVPTKTTSNIICKLPSSESKLDPLVDKEKIVRKLELSKETTVIVIDIQTEPVEIVKAQSNRVQNIDNKIINDSKSAYNEEKRKNTLQRATSTLPEKKNKVNDVVSSGPSKYSDLDTDILPSEEISLIKLPDKSAMPSSEPSTELTLSLEQSATSPSELSMPLIESSGQPEMSKSKPSTRVTRSSSDQLCSRSSTRLTRTAENSKPRTRTTRSLGQPEISHSKAITRLTRSSLQSAMTYSKSCTRVTRSSQQSAMPDLKPITTISKKNKKHLGDLLMKCVLDETVDHAKNIKNKIKTEEEPLNDELIEPILEKPSIPEEAAEIETVHSSIEPIQTESSKIPGIILIGEDSLSNDTSESQLRKESVETKSTHCMFLPDVVQSTEMRLHTDIALHETLLLDDDDDYDIIGEAEVSQKQTTDMGHIQQSSLIDRVVERSFRNEGSFLQIEDVYSLNVSNPVDQDEISDK